MRASVSAGSSQRETRVTCTPMAMVPSGGAARAGDGPAPAIPQTRPKIRTAAMRQDEGRIMTPPKEYSQSATSGLAFAGANAVRKLAHGALVTSPAQKGRGRKRACIGNRDWLWHG